MADLVLALLWLILSGKFILSEVWDSNDPVLLAVAVADVLCILTSLKIVCLYRNGLHAFLQILDLPFNGSVRLLLERTHFVVGDNRRSIQLLSNRGIDALVSLLIVNLDLHVRDVHYIPEVDVCYIDFSLELYLSKLITDSEVLYVLELI